MGLVAGSSLHNPSRFRGSALQYVKQKTSIKIFDLFDLQTYFRPVQMPSERPWCYKTLSVKGRSLSSQVGIHMGHLSTAAARVRSYTGILSDNNEIKGQVLPTTTELLSEDEKRMTRFQSPFAVRYVTKNGHRQWPSTSESTVAFAASCVCKTRADFGRQMVNLRKQHRMRELRGKDKAEFPLRDWAAPVKWGKNTHGRPPMERLAPFVSDEPVFTIGVSGGKAVPKALWPEVWPAGEWGKVTDPTEWVEKRRRANKKPHELLASQGIGISLPMLIPLDKDPRSNRLPMDQLTDNGGRNIQGLAALNGEMLERSGNATSLAKRLLAQF